MFYIRIAKYFYVYFIVTGFFVLMVESAVMIGRMDAMGTSDNYMELHFQYQNKLNKNTIVIIL